jgi:hypothetical protein
MMTAGQRTESEANSQEVENAVPRSTIPSLVIFAFIASSIGSWLFAQPARMLIAMALCGEPSI